MRGTVKGLAVIVVASLAAGGYAAELANWTFETSGPLLILNNSTASPIATAEGGVFAATSLAFGIHASPDTDWSSPSGNGSVESFSANTWTSGDYWEFQTSTLGYESITITWNQTRSSTGPDVFDLEWSLDGATFTTLLNDYTISAISWSSTTFNPASVFGPIAAPAALNNQPTVYFRLTSQVTPAAGGTNRIDNIVISGSEPGLTGACCIDGNCYIMTAAACQAGNGTYLGDNTTCEGDPCVLGACCIDGVCSVITKFACTTAGGTFLGAGSSCTPDPCIVACGTIAEARTAGPGVVVRLCDVTVSSVTDLVANATLKNFHMQDATGGITVWGPNADIDALLVQLAEGDKIDLQGKTLEYNGLFELTTPFNANAFVNHGFVGIPPPAVVTSTDFAEGSTTAEGLEGRLVRLNCATFVDTGTFAGLTNYLVNDPYGSLTVRVATNELNLVGAPIPSGPMSIVGIFSQYDPSLPYTGGYELLPRGLADLTLPGAGDGDLNCDGVVNAFDIDPFVLALTDPVAYQQQFPCCNVQNADINDDGVINAFDIDPFVLCLTTGSC